MALDWHRNNSKGIMAFEVMKVERVSCLETRLVSGTGSVFDWSIVRSSSVGHISNVTSMCIGNRVGYGLNTSIG